MGSALGQGESSSGGTLIGLESEVVIFKKQANRATGSFASSLSYDCLLPLTYSHHDAIC